jgi:5-methylcytosine-specific restriction endonuclease McrA
VNGRKHWHEPCARTWVIMNNPGKARAHVLKRDRLTCQDCGVRGRRETFDVDHVRPLFEADGDLSYWHPDNLRLLCQGCHHVKTQADMVRWRARQAVSDDEAGPK